MTTRPRFVGAGATLLVASSLLFLNTGVDAAVSVAPAALALVGALVVLLRLGQRRTLP